MSNSGEIDLDFWGIILSIFIPIIAFIIGRYYSTRKKRKIESLIDIMSKIDNRLDLYAWFELISTDGVINGEINTAQMELLRTHYEANKKRLEEKTNNNTPIISQVSREKMESYIEQLVKDGYPEEYAREHALNHLDKF
tara:strand:+ start:281 stop:697 length:417 start_codon:yes stop_codon:yes gene_type:complete